MNGQSRLFTRVRRQQMRQPIPSDEDVPDDNEAEAGQPICHDALRAEHDHRRTEHCNTR